MKILFIYPKYPETFWSFRHALKFVAKKSAFPPLGALTVAAMLPGEWEKRLVDENVSKLKDKDIEWADMVFISAMLAQGERAKEIIQRCKEKAKIVVAGGPAFTSQPEKFENVDHFVLNEAETTLPMFLEDFENGKLKHIYTSEERPDISKTPLPLWEILNFKKYSSMAIQYSRGCPFNCEFCDIIILNGRIPRTKTAEQMVGEFQHLYDAGWRGSIFVVDDNFIGNKANVKQMLPELIQWQQAHKYPFMLLTEASVNLAEDEELMQMMSRANFHKVFLGIETPDSESLKECGKVQNTNKNLAESVRLIHNHGMQVMGGFIVGFDNDNELIFDRQIGFIQKAGVVTAMIGTLTALPHTQLWNRLKTEGRLKGDSTGENTEASVNFEPKMGRKKLAEGYKNLVLKAYSYKNYYKRVNTFIKDYKPTAVSRLKKQDIRAFLMSIWRIGIFSKASPRYWKLLIKTSITKRKAVPVAVELAICGLHFRKFAKRTARAVQNI
ncbi:MAG: B12-binding domain-containing radical SAM protein [Candidatus Nanoarchaeia archaeon]|nr:B12-binding domain-containing radical SAM protein [Candidatus Nanoarchaeia archaeon]